MAMVLVIPVDEPPAETSGVLDAAKAFGKPRTKKLRSTGVRGKGLTRYRYQMVPGFIVGCSAASEKAMSTSARGCKFVTAWGWRSIALPDRGRGPARP
jgi:hypothetical protein